jgi:glycosyl transferase family 87
MPVSSSRSIDRTREGGLRWAIAAAMLLFAGGGFIQFFRAQAAIDFYQFWGIARARAISPEPLGSPYGMNSARYAALLNQSADRSSDRLFKSANASRRTIDPSATPLLYLAFAAMPRDFATAEAVYRILQMVALIAAVTWLARLLGSDLATALTLAAVVAVFYQPFQIELVVGNVNSLQLLACVALLAWTRRGARAWSGAWFAGALAAFLLFKPNLALVGVALGGWLAVSIGWRRSWIALLAAGVVAVLLVVVSSVWLGAASAWPEWLAFVRGAGGSKMADYPTYKGNDALVMLLRGDSPASRCFAMSIAIALLMVATWLAAAWRGRGQRGFPEALRALMEDPWLLVSTALLVVLAASPLVWFHYALLAIVPCLWLGMTEPRSRLVPLLAFCSLFAYSRFLLPYMAAMGHPTVEAGWAPWSIALAWIPAWAALLWRLACAPIEVAPLEMHGA